MTTDWRAQDAQANYAEALRCMRAALLEKRARSEKGMIAEAGRAAGMLEGIPALTTREEPNAATR